MRRGKIPTTFAVMFFVIIIAVGCGAKEETAEQNSVNFNNSTSKETASEEAEMMETSEESTELDGYPDQSLTVLVGYEPGGGSDTNARAMISALTETGIIEQSMQVENLPGSSGVHAFTKLYQEPDNKYQLLDVPEMGIPLINGSMDADYDDFQPVAQVASGTLVVLVGADSPYETVEQLLADMESDPRSITIATSGALDSSEPYRWYTIFDELQSETVDLGELNFVPQDGTAGSITSVVGGHTDVSLVNPGLIVDHVEAGEAKVLAVLSPERLDAFPDAPTLVETGIDIVHNRARGWWMGVEVSQEVVQFWEDTLREATQTEQWTEYLTANFFELDFRGAKEYTEFLKEEGERFGSYLQMVQEAR